MIFLLLRPSLLLAGPALRLWQDQKQRGSFNSASNQLAIIRHRKSTKSSEIEACHAWGHLCRTCYLASFGRKPREVTGAAQSKTSPAVSQVRVLTGQPWATGPTCCHPWPFGKRQRSTQAKVSQPSRGRSPAGPHWGFLSLAHRRGFVSPAFPHWRRSFSTEQSSSDQLVTLFDARPTARPLCQRPGSAAPIRGGFDDWSSSTKVSS